MSDVSKKMIPSDHHTDLIYECPECECEHWKTLEETKLPHQVFQCECGYRQDMAQVSSLSVKASFEPMAGGKKKYKVESGPTTTEHQVRLDAAEILHNQGYSIRQSNTLLDKAFEYNPVTVADWVRYSLAEALAEV